MTFGTFLVTFGLAGVSLLLGVTVGTFWLSNQIRDLGFWFFALLFMGLVGAVVTSYSPIVQPLWLHYVLIVLTPFVLGIVGLSLLIGRGGAVKGE
ncbi:MAG: hypothetical protein P0Y60_02820 [Candidatus Microbacterium colombiense]|nr:MAG: hypothetical protein P0Y60_02820 [Microbacterium sp.]